MVELQSGSGLSLMEALVATADRRIWARYCRAAAEIEGRAAEPVFAVGSVEWRRQQEAPSAQRDADYLSAEQEAAGRRRLAQRGAPPPFAGAPSPFGASGGPAFDEFVGRRRGPPALLAESDALERELVDGFEAAGRAARYRASGFQDGAKTHLEPDWFGKIGLDFAGNRVRLPGGSEVVAIEVTLAANAAAGGAGRERPARVMLREALIVLWERGAFTAGTGNERVLALALRELGLSAADPPYGFKSAETVRKLRKTLKMCL